MSRNYQLFDDLPEQTAPVSVFQAGVDPVWTEHKAQLIARYLRYFVFITKHGAYIDGFAAPKDPDNPESWAAKLVVNSTPKFLKQFFLCEIDRRRASHLYELKKSQPSKPNRTIEVLEGDFNNVIDEILGSGLITDKTASFCLLDQYSCECHWRTLEKLAAHKSIGEHKIELFYFLATGWLGRSLSGFSVNTEEPKLWWGKPDWRSLIGRGGDSIALEMSERFRDELGYRYVSPWPIYEKEKGTGRVMFHMIHASDHYEAPKLMRRAFKNVLSAPEPEEQLEMELSDL